MSKRVIGVDIDGVLADFNSSFINLVISVTGRDLFPPRPFDIPCWNYPEHYGYTFEEATLVWGVIEESPDFWLTLRPYRGVSESINYLTDQQDKGADVYFVTSRPGRSSKQQTEHWLANYGFHMPTVLISSDKAGISRSLRFDAYIDDRWENAVTVASEGHGRSVLMDRPWNRGMGDEHVQIIRTDTVVGFADLLFAKEPTTA